jgi:hypothetical protein
VSGFDLTDSTTQAPQWLRNQGLLQTDEESRYDGLRGVVHEPWPPASEKIEGKMSYSSSVSNAGAGIFMAYLIDGASTPNTVNSSVVRTREYLSY